MNWGHKIIIAFVLFGVFIITLVTICVRSDFYLVSPDYYQQELDYENRIIQTQNVMQLNEKPELQYVSDSRVLNIVFPKGLGNEMQRGEIYFFRPSNAGSDFSSPLKLDLNGSQTINLNSRPKGLWKIELRWKDGQKDYYMSEKIYL